MMIKSNYSNNLTLFQKLRNYDYVLVMCILIVGIISIFTMYSTDGGQVLYHTKSHFLKFSIFFPLMIILSFINIKFWHSTSYIFYLIVLGLLIWVALYGVKASGSKRWIDLYFLNLQPSELMKIGIILCLARYFHRVRTDKINSFATILIYFFCQIIELNIAIVDSLANNYTFNFFII